MTSTAPTAPAGPPTAEVPADTTLALAGTWPRDDVLVGGRPRHVLRVSPEGTRIVQALTAGARIGDLDHPDAAVLARALIDAGLAEPRVPLAVHAADVTVVIPAHQAEATLPTVLASVPGPCDVVVVDDGSTDGTGEVARQRGATVIRHDRARGPAAARNAGVAAVERRFVAFLDADTSPLGGWLDPLMAVLGDPRVGAVAPRVSGRVPAGAGLLARFERAASPLDLGPDGGLVQRGTRLAFVPTAAMVARTEAIRSVGGLDEELHFGEDQDLVWRLQDAGWLVRYEPTSVVEHEARPTLRSLLRRRVGYGSPGPALERRHPATMRAGSAPAWMLVAAAALVGRRPRLALGVGAAGAARDALTLARVLGPRAGAEAGSRRAVAGARSLAATLTRQWLPAAAMIGTRSPRTLAVTTAALALRHGESWLRRRPDVGLAAWTALSVLDDAAFAVGLWGAAARARMAAPLVPHPLGPPLRPSPHPWPPALVDDAWIVL